MGDVVEPGSSTPVSVRGASDTEARDLELMSGLRIKVAFIAFTIVMVAAMTGLVFAFVGHIFSTLTPHIVEDLKNKALHGSEEIALATDLYIAARDLRRIEDEIADYEHDPDLVSVVVTDAEDAVLLTWGTAPEPMAELFRGDAARLTRRESFINAWSIATIDGKAVGKVAVAVSTRRLSENDALERRILSFASVSAVIALCAAFSFVRFHLSPLIRVSELAFARLEKTTRAALEATRIKSEFLANMSHEIRTPLNGVLGMLELLGSTKLDERQRRYLGTLAGSAQSLLTVLNDVLDFSKIEAGKLTIQYEVGSVRELIEEVGELFAPRAHGKGIELYCHVESSVPEQLEIDGDRLRQVLSNLTGNALKFTERGQIVLSARLDAQSKRIRFAVVDTGIGIAAEVVPRLFEAFVQADGSLTRRYGGTGLGLSICKNLVALMGGEMGVESEFGKGSTFWFNLPVRDARERPLTELERPRYAARTLIVDDNATNRLVLEELLQRWGLEHVSVDSAEAALVEIDRSEQAGTRFDVIISDFNMPITDGASLALAAQTLEPGRRPRFILLTSTDTPRVENAGSGGIDARLQKPIRSRDLLRCLNRVLSERPVGKLPAARSFAPSLRPRRLHPLPILVVEDNPVNQEVMTESLAELGIGADIAENGQLALEALERREYPLIFMDCQMPVLDGYQTASQIRKTEAGRRHVPIVGVTAHAFEGEREKVLAAGMDDYMTKPVKQAALREAIERWWPGALDAADSSVPEGPSASETRSTKQPVSEHVLQVFARVAPLQLAELEAAVVVGDAASLARAAHKLKGGCQATGNARMAQLCAELESNPPHRAELCLELRRELQQVTLDVNAAPQRGVGSA